MNPTGPINTKTGTGTGTDSADWRRTDRGAVSVMMAILLLAIIACLGLVVTGGRQLTALTEAREIAANAARAGAQAADEASWRERGRPRVDRAQAEQRIADYLAVLQAAGVADRVTVEWVDSVGPDAERTVTVRATVTPAPFLGLSALAPRTVEAVESAEVLGGVDAPISP